MSVAVRPVADFPQGDLVALAESVSEGVAICRNGKVAWANSRFAERMGQCSAQALVGSVFQELFVDTGRGVPNASSWRELECALRVVNAGPRAVRLQRVDLPGSETSELWVVGDHEATALDSRGREIADLRERLQGESRSRNELRAFVSHELRTPLTLVQGYNRLLLGCSDLELSDEQRRFLEESTHNCRKMSGILDRLSDEARGGAAPCDAVRLEEASLEATVRSALERVAPIFGNLDIEIDLRIDSKDERFQFDPSRIEQVFVNLLENAAKYGGSPGSVEIASRAIRRRGSRFVEISLSDKGPGIAESDREHVFESGVRLISGNPEPGSGLGLYISRRIVRAHGGHMTVVGNPGGGSAFVFTLPLCVADGERSG